MKVFYDDIGVITVVSESIPSKVNYGDLELQAISTTPHLCYKIPSLDVTKHHHVFVDSIECSVIMRGITKTSWFKETYMSSKVLGCSIEDGKSWFRVFAPTAQCVLLHLNKTVYAMTKDEQGIFEVCVDKNVHGMDYVYEVLRYNQSKFTTDPYAIASLPNRKASVAVDLNRVLDKDASLFKASPHPIILEASVRDFSMDLEVPFINRGKFLGMLESYGQYGFNHIKDLGVTHVQLMPVADFETVDELDPVRNYNWGYDTMQSMVLEGSYSSNVKDPLQIIKDFKKLVDGYHREGIGINLDVVFNHVYDVASHPLNILEPYYFFRYTENYELSNGSFCGNELSSEMPMARRYIVDSVVYYAKTFDVDGFRFDLMGLSDIDTMNNVMTSLLEVKPSIMVYGEGWSMPSVLDKELEASMNNASKMSHIGHFNDRFRDAIIGSMDGSKLGLDIEKATYETLNHLLNQSHNFIGEANQSIQYVECHDNLTLADRLIINGKDVNAAYPMIAMVILGKGVPFLQLGQSFFRDKKGNENSYNLPDSINAIDWSYLNQYNELNEYIKGLIQLRKSNPGKTFEIGDNTVIELTDRKIKYPKNALFKR